MVFFTSSVVFDRPLPTRSRFGSTASLRVLQSNSANPEPSRPKSFSAAFFGSSRASQIRFALYQAVMGSPAEVDQIGVTGMKPRELESLWACATPQIPASVAQRPATIPARIASESIPLPFSAMFFSACFFGMAEFG